ncbi:matrixin family metalloprotease [Pseudohongiella nitratireducens]|uniref:matrixin family metalloprotease n=1 Tax=Pseudohongiella nitratireducens TaxID=1768907 RepID=UPI0030EC79DB
MTVFSKCKTFLHSLPTGFTLALFAGSTQAFVYQSNPNPLKDDVLTYQVDIPGLAPSGVSWNTAFDQAVEDWVAVTGLDIRVIRETSNPCEQFNHNTGRGYVGFVMDACDGYWSGFFAHHPAFATVVSNREQEVLSSNILFDGNVKWDIYSGELYWERSSELGENDQPAGEWIYDFRRTAKHEIGHALGLGHGYFPHSIMSYADDTTNSDSLSIDDICGVNIAHGNPEGCSLLLSNPATFSGETTTAMFVGGASNDRGVSFNNSFRANDTIDIMATVVIEPEHFDKAGRMLTVIQFSDGTALMKTDIGFAPWDGSVEALRSTESKPLKYSNEIYVLKDFNLKENGVSNTEVSVYVGYSLDEQPDEVYFSGSPIFFAIEP